MKKSYIITGFLCILSIVIIYFMKTFSKPLLDHQNEFALGICVCVILTLYFVISSVLLKKICRKENLFAERASFVITNKERAFDIMKGIIIGIILLLVYYYITTTAPVSIFQYVSSLALPVITLYVCFIIYIETPLKTNVPYKYMLIIEYVVLFHTGVNIFLYSY